MPPRFLLLYGSLRERSFSRLLTQEAARLLSAMGAEVKIFNPSGLPLPDDAPESHPKVIELRALCEWAEGMVWCSPERHGAMPGIMKAQIDWIPLTLGAVRPTQGKTLAVMQVCGGSQSFNAVNQLRVLGRWMRMLTIPNQSSLPKAFTEFDDEGRMKPSAYFDRVVNARVAFSPNDPHWDFNLWAHNVFGKDTVTARGQDFLGTYIVKRMAPRMVGIQAKYFFD